MKRFISFSLGYFVLPFVILYAFNILFYNKDEGDLVRLGFLYSNPTPRSSINEQFQQKITYDTLSGIDLFENHSYDILTIGDSFSEGHEFGYKNYLSKKDLSILHLDRFITGDNPNQKLIELLNSPFFENVKVKYVILQNVEREFNNRLKQLDYTKHQNLDSLSQQIRNYKRVKPDYSNDFFSQALFKIPLTNILYNFHPKPLESNTYKVKLNTNNLFTNSVSNLLFYQTDLDRIQDKNNNFLIKHSVSQLNHINLILSKKKIKLIVLVSPDKYDLYYDFLTKKNQFVKPLFFSRYNKIEKNYVDVNAYEILTNKTSVIKDLYYYDDTHWSPKGSKIVAEEIYRIISK